MGAKRRDEESPAREKGSPAGGPAGWGAIPAVRAQGYVVIPRALGETPMWQQQREFSLAEAYVDLVLQARWSTEAQDVVTRDGRVMRVQRGESWRS